MIVVNPIVKKSRLIITLTLLVLFQPVVHAEALFMIRSSLSFPEAMSSLQAAIKKQGNVLSHVQRVDIGLTKMGYKTDKYRVVFYGRQKQIKKLATKYPELVPYLPLKIAIFSENGETVLSANNPRNLESMYPAAQLIPVFRKWSDDLRAILDAVLKDSN